MWLLQTVTDAKFVVVYAVDSNAEQIAVAFEPNGKGDYVNTRLSSLFLTSSYGKNNYIRNNIKNTWLILNMQKMTYRKLIPNCMSGWQLLTTNHLMMIGYHKTVIKATPYRAKIIVGFTKRGEMLLYDIVGITPTVFVMKKERAYRSDSQQSESTSRNGAPFVAMISQFTAKNNPSTENNLNGPKSKDDTIFDDFEDEEVMFTADGDIAFDGFGADAQRTIDVKEMVQEQGAEHAVYTMYNAAARTAEKAIKGHSGIQQRQIKEPAVFYRDLYYKTAGEIEARDSESRINLSEAQRKEKRPDIDRDEVVFSEGGVSYEIKYQQFTEKDYYNNSLKLQKMNAVEELTGEEFSYDGTPLNKRVLRYFRELGNNIYSDVFGDVALNNSSVHDDLGHGKTKYKIASFKAVPAVIKKGVVIDSQRRGNGNYDRIIVAAPITIAKESYIMGVMLQRDKQSQRLYLHDVVAISKKETTKVGEVTPITTETATLNDSLYMTSILLKAYNVKEKTTYPNAKYSKDDTIFDDFEDEVMFTADGDIAFDGFGADAQRTIDVKEPVQEQGAEHAVYTLYNAAARTAEKAIKGHSDIQLGEQNYERIAKKLMRQLKTVTITIQINGLDSVTRAVCFLCG